MLTSEAKSMLYDLYKEYKNRRYNGVDRSSAKSFGSSEHLHNSLFQSWHLSDVEDIMRELDQNGYLSNLYASNKIHESELTNRAISELDNLPKEFISNVASFIAKFIP